MGNIKVHSWFFYTFVVFFKNMIRIQKFIKTIGLIKLKKNLYSWLVIWVVFIVSFLTSCNDPNDLGMELLPSDDLITVNTLEEKESILAFTTLEDLIRTDEPSKSLLGILDDPLFGRTTINFATQFYLQTFPDFGTNTVVDSVDLYLYYR